MKQQSLPATLTLGHKLIWMRFKFHCKRLAFAWLYRGPTRDETLHLIMSLSAAADNRYSCKTGPFFKTLRITKEHYSLSAYSKNEDESSSSWSKTHSPWGLVWCWSCRSQWSFLRIQAPPRTQVSYIHVRSSSIRTQEIIVIHISSNN